jgi:hypothetical protein
MTGPCRTFPKIPDTSKIPGNKLSLYDRNASLGQKCTFATQIRLKQEALYSFPLVGKLILAPPTSFPSPPFPNPTHFPHFPHLFSHLPPQSPTPPLHLPLHLSLFSSVPNFMDCNLYFSWCTGSPAY